MKYVQNFFLATLLIFNTSKASEMKISTTRFYESTNVIIDSYRNTIGAECNNQRCRFLEVEIKNDTILNIRNCITNYGPASKGLLNRSEYSCENILSDYKLADYERRSLDQKSLLKAPDSTRVTIECGKTLLYGFTSAITAVIANNLRNIKSIGLGAASLYTGGKAIKSGILLKKETLGKTTLMSVNSNKTVAEALDANGVTGYYVLPNKVEIDGIESLFYTDSENFSSEYNAYVKGWVYFAAKLKQ